MSYSKNIIFFFWLVLLPFTQVIIGQDVKDTIQELPFDSIHSPKKAVIFAAILPSLGHIYNDVKRLPHHKSHLWWKLPIIYGGLGAAGYFIVDNNRQFKAFKQERINRLDPLYDPLTGDYALYADFQLVQIQEQYRKWRDLSVIATLGVYLLQMIDANVEGHLMHFDMSNDLSFDFHPNVLYMNDYHTKAFGATLRLNF